MLKGLQSRYKFDMEQDEEDSYVERELGKVIEKLNQSAQPCVGVMPVLEKLSKEGKYGMSVVSSSALSRVQASIKKTEMDRFFREDYVFSAATSLPKPTSKPDPAVYLHACKVIGVKPEECVAVEDSKSGATAAKRAGIPLIGYVGSYEDEGLDEVKAKEEMLLKECGAVAVMRNWNEWEKALEKVLQS